MKILMIGLGSIGQRHLRNIKRLYGDAVDIIAYRCRGLQTTFSDDMQIRENIALEEEFHIKTYADLDIALSQKPDIAFITNITSQHIVCALKCADAGCNLFIEKPLSDDMWGIYELIKIVENKKLIAFIGFQNRYHPCLKKMKSILNEKEMGGVLSVEACVGERLKTMHDYEDYRTTYMARKDMGGGVVLNQSIHELDYLIHIFGVPKSVYAVGGQLSSLEIDTEDTSVSLFELKIDTRIIPMTVHSDFLQYPSSRYCNIVCDNGKIGADIINNKIEWSVGDERFLETYPDFKRNDMFVAELEDFMDSVKTRTAPAITLREAIDSLKTALAIKQSYTQRKKIILA